MLVKGCYVGKGLFGKSRHKGRDESLEMQLLFKLSRACLK